jgi:hypothetical protein
VTLTPEEIRDELVENLSAKLVSEYLEDGIDHLTVAEFLGDEGYDSDDDLISDVFTSANGTLDTILQRWEDD